MIINKLTFNSSDFPEQLRQIPAPPRQLFHIGVPLTGLLKRPRVAIVGSRNMSPYGQQVTQRLASELAEQGVIIISGLAMGVDYLAHRAALDAGGLAIAVLPGPLDAIVPVINQGLAEEIIQKDGALVSEYESGTLTYRKNFVARNRLVSGLADAVIITEAGEKSGSLHTANFAIKQGRIVMAVPGNIYSNGCVGTNNLLKRGHAAPITSYKDVMHELGFKTHKTALRNVKGRNAHEQTVLDLMLQGITEGDELFNRSALDISSFNQVLTMLEIGGKIQPLGANHWAIF